MPAKEAEEGQATEPKQATPKQSNEERALAIVDDSLANYKSEFVRLLGNSIDPEVFMSVAYEAFRTSPDLLEVALNAPDSLMKALHDAAALKLLPNGVLGSAYIVPRRNKNTGRKEAYFQPGYRGLVELIIRSGHVSHVESRLVYVKDEFELTYGTNPDIEHKPFLDGERGKLRGAYAVAFMRDGSKLTEFMSVAQIDVIKGRAASKSGPWATDYEEMCRKTVVRRIAKSLPMSVEVQRAVELDDRAEVGEVVATVTKPTTGSASLAGRIRQNIGTAEPEQIGTLDDGVGTPVVESKEEPKNVTPESTDDSGTAHADPAPEEAPAQATEPAAAAPKAKPRQSAKAAAPKQEEPKAAPDDPIEASDDVPGDEPVATAPQKSFISALKPPRDPQTWQGIVETDGDTVKLATAAWKGKLLPADGSIAVFFDSLSDVRYNVDISGVLELIPWDRDGKSMPPYRQITVYALHVGEPVEPGL